MRKMTFEAYGAVISALACVVCAVGLYKTSEPICLIWGCLAFMTFVGCVAELIEKGGADYE